MLTLVPSGGDPRPDRRAPRAARLRPRPGPPRRPPPRPPPSVTPPLRGSPGRAAACPREPRAAQGWACDRLLGHRVTVRTRRRASPSAHRAASGRPPVRGHRGCRGREHPRRAGGRARTSFLWHKWPGAKGSTQGHVHESCHEGRPKGRASGCDVSLPPAGRGSPSRACAPARGVGAAREPGPAGRWTVLSAVALICIPLIADEVKHLPT